MTRDQKNNILLKDILKSNKFLEIQEMDQKLRDAGREIENLDTEFKEIIDRSTEKLTSKRILTSVPFDIWNRENSRWKIGLNNRGIGVYYSGGGLEGSLSKLNNIDQYKNFDWDEFLNQIKVKGERRERLYKLGDAILLYNIDDVETEKELDGIDFIDLSGDEHNYAKLSFRNSNYYLKDIFQKILLMNIDQKLTKFFFASQIFDEFKDVFISHLNALNGKLDKNREIVNKLKNDLDYFLVLDEI